MDASGTGSCHGRMARALQAKETTATGRLEDRVTLAAHGALAGFRQVAAVSSRAISIPPNGREDRFEVIVFLSFVCIVTFD